MFYRNYMYFYNFAGNMVPVSGGPPVMVRPMEGATSLPAAWSVQPNQPPLQMGGPQHPPPSGTPTSANHLPRPFATPPNSGMVQQQHPTGAPSNHPQSNAAGVHGQPQLAPNGNAAVGNAGQPAAALANYKWLAGSPCLAFCSVGLLHFVPGPLSLLHIQFLGELR